MQFLKCWFLFYSFFRFIMFEWNGAFRSFTQLHKTGRPQLWKEDFQVKELLFEISFEVGEQCQSLAILNYRTLSWDYVTVMAFAEFHQDEFIFWTLQHLFLGQGRLSISENNSCICQRYYVYLSKVLCIFVTGSGRLTKLHAGSGFDPRQGSSQKLTLNPRTLSILAKKKLANNSDFWLVNQDRSWSLIGQYFAKHYCKS